MEDQLAIYQVIRAYGYSVDGLNAASVGSCYVDDGAPAEPALLGRLKGGPSAA